MADDDTGELAPSTSISTATSATTVGATPTAAGATPTTVLGDKDEEEEEPKPKPGKKRSASSAKKVKKTNGATCSGESADGGKHSVKVSCIKKTRRGRGITVILLFVLSLH
jgi:hypothetical protein